MLKVFGKFYVVSKITVQQRNLKQQKPIKSYEKLAHSNENKNVLVILIRKIE